MTMASRQFSEAAEEMVFFINYIEMTWLTAGPLGYPLAQEQQIEVVSQLLRCVQNSRIKLALL